VFSSEEIIERIGNITTNPLKGLKVAPYYGCMSLRPPKVTDVADCENPDTMERIITATGADIVGWSFRSICCGGGLSLSRTDIVKKMMLRIFEMADEAQADCLVTSCPMCHANLDTRMEEISTEYSRDFSIPVLYFSEMIGLAMGMNSKKWFKRHIISPVKMLKEKELM
jgi:heterodisulfide reductase subunit B